MKKSILSIFALIFVVFAFAAFAQTPNLKRTMTKTDRFDFGSGGTISIVGAPNGSITINGTSKNEIEITAEIQVEAQNEADLAKLADVTGFITEESNVRTSIISVGTHDKQYLKKNKKKLPGNLLAMPFRIDYVVNVPHYSDIQIDGGKGDLSVSGVDGSLVIKFLNTTAKLDLIGGSTSAVIGSGSVDVNIASQSWRGRSADVQIGDGTLNVTLPFVFNAEVDATILKSGSIENSITTLKPRDRKIGFTDKSIIARTGSGGVPLKFTVSSGKLKLQNPSAAFVKP